MHFLKIMFWMQFCWNNFTNTDAEIKLYYFLECNNLYQIIDEPTRITASRESILDLIISDSPGTLSPPANCDHNLIFATLSFPVNKKRSYRRRIWKFNGVNEDALNNALVNADWESTWLSSSGFELWFLRAMVSSVLQNCQLAYPAFRKFRKFIIDYFENWSPSFTKNWRVQLTLVCPFSLYVLHTSLLRDKEISYFFVHSAALWFPWVATAQIKCTPPRSSCR